MLRSLFTGISGLTAHQQMLDVTANNIANVNTAGFKASSTVFQDTLSQTLQGAAAASATVGGTNAHQIGLGVRLGGTELNMTQGASQATGVGTNVMINGDGFFAVQKNGETLYTRGGAFHLDDNGALVTPDGAVVLDDQGTAIDLSDLFDPNQDFVSYSIGPDGAINAVDGNGASTQLGQIGVATFPNPNGLVKAGNSQFRESVSSGNPNLGIPGNGRGDLSAGYLEMSNADLSLELTNLIIAQRGFQANSKSVTTADQILQTLVTLKQ